jgi:hypothetical protein
MSIRGEEHHRLQDPDMIRRSHKSRMGDQDEGRLLYKYHWLHVHKKNLQRVGGLRHCRFAHRRSNNHNCDVHCWRRISIHGDRNVHPRHILRSCGRTPRQPNHQDKRNARKTYRHTFGSSEQHPGPPVLRIPAPWRPGHKCHHFDTADGKSNCWGRQSCSRHRHRRRRRLSWGGCSPV